jgi:hypothetical protein
VWRAIVYGYKAPTTPPTDKDGKKLKDNDTKAKNAILNGLTESIYTKVSTVNPQKRYGTH